MSRDQWIGFIRGGSLMTAVLCAVSMAGHVADSNPLGTALNGAALLLNAYFIIHPEAIVR